MVQIRFLLCIMAFARKIKVPKYFILGCSCGAKIQVSSQEERTEVRCPQCHRYVRVPRWDDVQLPNNIQNRLIGKILENRYRIEAYLADGAMGRVYRATDLTLNIPVAIKVLKTFYSSLEQQEKRFLTEAKIAYELVHPGIVLVRNLHRTRKGVYFMVMDLCPGQSLKDILVFKPRLSIAETIDIGKQLLAALDVAHQKGIIHRDIKPGNIMIEETSQGRKVRILDFGIAKVFSNTAGFVLESLTRPGFIIGTTKYMAPEQVVKTKMSAATDLYAVGALLYHLLSGEPPFSDGNRDKILRDIVRKNPMPLQEIFKQNGYPEKIHWFLDAIILKALQKEPWQRFRNAHEFMQALEIYEQSQQYHSWLTLKIIASNTYYRYHTQLQWLGLIIAIVIALFAVLQYHFHIFSRDNFYRQQVNFSIQQHQYEQAYQYLALISDDSIQHKQQKLFVLNKSLLEQLEDKSNEKKINLQHLEKEMNASWSFRLVQTFIEEQQFQVKWEEYIDKGNYKEAEQLDKMYPISDFLKTLQVRAEMQNWLNQWVSKPKKG